MFSERHIGSSLSSLVKKLGLGFGDSASSYKKLASVKGHKVGALRGFVAMSVGEEGKRYEVPRKYLTVPMFRKFVQQTVAGHLDFKTGDTIVLVCTTGTFDQLLKQVKRQYTKDSV